MIRREDFLLGPASPEQGPPLIGKEWAEAPCGCKVFVGMRLDTKEMATANVPCDDKHDELVVDLQKRMKASLDVTSPFGEPQERPAVEVFDEMLMAIYEEYENAPA